MDKQYSLAFSEQTPSLFVLSSPLQVICAVEAIHKFRISEYRVILVLADDVRNGQVFALCSQCGIKYEIVNIPNISTGKIQLLKKQINKYKRVFIGDPRSISQLQVAYSICSNHSVFVMLDDGDDNIFMLMGYSFWKDKGWKDRLYALYFYSIIPIFRKINFGRYLFTIYSNIQTKKFSCVANTFEYFSQSLKSNNLQDGVFFVGTNHNRYCEPGNYPIEMVKKGLEEVFKELKNEYLEEPIYYIPHGRDTELFPEELCEKYGIIFKRPQKTVELMFIDLGITPKAVYGFTSTALYNIKLLFPKAEVYNVVFNVNHANLFIKQTEVISEYYKQQGIKEIRI